MRAVIVKPDALEDREQMVVRQALLFGNKGDHIFTEAVNTEIEPELEDLLDLCSDKRIVHVEIRLLDGKQMQIIFLPQIVPLPCLALKMTVPVVRQFSVRLCGPPDIIIGIRLDAPPGFLEPFMLVARVIDDQIHDKLHPALVQAVQNSPECLHAAVFRCNVHVIRNIIAAVRAGRRIERREPDAVNAELLQIVELLQYPPQIADPVAVSVAEAPGPDLIKNHVLKPSCMTHIHFSPCRSLVSITTILL